METERLDSLPPRVDVAVVGGGICGCVCAAELARRGARVLVLEKEAELGEEASGRSFGGLRLQGRHPAELPLARAALDLWAKAARTLPPPDIEFVQGGNLYVAEQESELEELRVTRDGAHAAGFSDVRLLTADETREIVPDLTGEFAGALYSPRDGHCDPKRAVLAYAAQARQHGALVALRTKAVDLLVSDGAVAGIVTDRGQVRADRVVVAAGVWTPHLLKRLGFRIPLKRIVYTCAETSPLPPLFRPTIRGFSFSVRQRPNGQLVLGCGLNATVESPLSLDDLVDLRLWLPRYLAHRRQIVLRLDVGSVWGDVRATARGRPATDRVPVAVHPPGNAAAVEGAFAALRRRMPRARDVDMTRTWAGFIDLSPDGLPVIERAARPRGLVFLTGLSGHGLCLAPVFGQILADLATGGETAYDLSPFRLGRLHAPRVPMPPRLI
ncbi:MAG: FAD-binding oxidoreductase [Candidatus Rokubacteria bacterium]|nr:FAD-binding oxidoreductase [Candidatus Rokubacteria bacterium]